MLGAVIFDFDGVITDSEILHLRSFNQVLARFGVEITTKDYYKDYLGLTDSECFESLADRGRLGLDEDGIEHLIKQKNQIFEKLAKTEGSIIEGVRDFLEMLKYHGHPGRGHGLEARGTIPMAICSGALLAEIELILEQARLRRFFEVIVSAEQIKKGKPNPEGLLLTLAKLNHDRRVRIAAGQCVVIEDSHWGLEAAEAAGMHTVAVTNSYDAEQLQPAEKIVTQLMELSIGDLQELCA